MNLKVKAIDKVDKMSHWLTSVILLVMVACSSINSLPTSTTENVPVSLPSQERHARQEEAVEGAAEGAVEAVSEAAEIGGAYVNIGQILGGVFRGDIRPILAGSVAFVPEGGVRDGVNHILQSEVAPQLQRIITGVVGNALNHSTTTAASVPTQQILNQNQNGNLNTNLNQNANQNTNPNYNSFNPDNNNNHLLPNNGYNNNNFQNIPGGYENNNFNQNFNGYDINNFNQVYTNLKPVNNGYNNNNFNQNNPTNSPQQQQSQNNNNNAESGASIGGFQLPNPIQLIRDRLSGNGNQTGPPNPIQLIRDRLSGNGGPPSLPPLPPNPLQLLQERLNGNSSSGSPFQAIQERIQSLLGGGNSNSNNNNANNGNSNNNSNNPNNNNNSLAPNFSIPSRNGIPFSPNH